MSVFDVIENPPLLHAIIVHFPVVLGVLGVPLVFLAVLLDTERNVLRWLAVTAYALLVVCALAAVESGERAHARVPNTLPPEVHELISQHQEMAHYVWMPAAAAAVLLVLSVVKIRWFRNTMTLLAMLASLICAGLVTFTGHYGGTLVHKYGVSGAIMLRADGTAPPPLVTTTTPQEVEKPQQPAPPVEKPVEAAPAPAAPPAVQLPPLPTVPPSAEVAAPSPAPAMETVSYVKNVQPIFQARCVGCHGDSEPKGELSLTSVAGMMKSGEHSGVGVTPGQPENSSIIKHIRGDLEPRMPPGVLPLSEADIETLRRWIAEGAKDDSL